MNIAILSPKKETYSETFIQAHKRLKGKVYFFYGGEIPKKVENARTGKFLFLRILFFLKRRLTSQNNLLDKYILKTNLIKYKIDIGLAEYGTTGALSYPVFEQLKIPIIVHFHGYDASVVNIVQKYKSEYEKMFEYALAIIVVSNTMKDDLLKLGADISKILVNPCGPSDSFLELVRKKAKNKFFLYVGRFTEKKNPILTIKAFYICQKSEPDVELVMVGEGSLMDDSKRLVAQLGISEKVRFLGILNKLEIANLMVSAFAFILHSTTADNGDKEGTPVSLLEAMASGLPIISTFHAGIQDVVVPDETGFLVEENDEKGTVDSMIWLLNNPEKAKEMGRAGRDRIKKNYTMTHHLNKINQLISNSNV